VLLPIFTSYSERGAFIIPYFTLLVREISILNPALS
jgi:hypothetical protein